MKSIEPGAQRKGDRRVRNALFVGCITNVSSWHSLSQFAPRRSQRNSMRPQCQQLAVQATPTIGDFSWYLHFTVSGSSDIDFGVILFKCHLILVSRSLNVSPAPGT